MRPYNWPQLLGMAAFVSVLLIALRMIWIFPGSRFSWMIRHRLLGQKRPSINNRQLIVLGWSGLRGVLTLAAALSLPETTDNGAPFPHRDIVIFLAFSVILVTLVGQGLTLPYLTRRLGVCGSPDALAEERDARRALLNAALNELALMKQDSQANAVSTEAFHRVVEYLERSYSARLDGLQQEEEREGGGPRGEEISDAKIYAEFAGRARRAERSKLYSLLEDGAIGDGTVRRLERELDLLDLRFSAE